MHDWDVHIDVIYIFMYILSYVDFSSGTLEDIFQNFTFLS